MMYSDSSYFTGLKGLEWTFITCLKDYPDEEHGNKSSVETFIDRNLNMKE